MLFFETSSKEGHSVENAFIEVARKGLKQMDTTTISLTGSGSGASGAIILNPALVSG